MTAIRRSGASSAAVLLALSASIVAAHLLAPEWSRRTGLDVWNLPSATADFHAATEAREAVCAHEDRSARRREAANQIAITLATGTITLSAATDEVMEVFRGDAGVATTLESIHPTVPTERLRFARHMIERAKRNLADDPARCAVVVARLENEYRALSASPEAPRGR